MKRVFLVWALVLQFLPTSIWADDLQKRDVIIFANGDYDVFIETTEEELTPFVKELNIEIGGTKIVEYDYLKNIISQFTPVKKAFGGSAANTAYTLSSLGKQNGLYVVLSDEELSQGFIQDLESVGVENYGSYIPKDIRGNDSVMTQLAAFISNPGTSNSERTFVAYKGLSADFSNVQFDLSHIKNYKILFIEGYVFSPKSKDVIFAAIKEAKNHNVKVLFAPSDPYFVNTYKEDFQAIIDQSDIVFTNHGEVNTLFEHDDVDNGIKKLAEQVNIAIVTNGNNGSIIYHNFGKQQSSVNVSIDQSKVIDTTGAGDAYLAGFLYGYLNGFDMETSGKTGAMVANHIIQEISGRPSKKMLDKIKESL